jgi:predicted ribonuclease YlaK
LGKSRRYNSKYDQNDEPDVSFKSKDGLTFKNSNDTNSILGISFSDNPEQRELIRLMNENNKPVIFCTGDAGTGKTFTAVAAAIDLVRIKRKYRHIYYIREPIEVGKSLGFLPGDLDDKYGVYLDGLMDNLDHISEYSGISKNNLKECIECIPPQFVRGRSFFDSIILVDEAQNLDLDTIHTLMTRIGKYCKIVFMGSLNQIDVKGKNKDNNDFIKAYNIVKDLTDLVSYVELTKSERSEYCKIFDETFTKYKEENKL